MKKVAVMYSLLIGYFLIVPATLIYSCICALMFLENPIVIFKEFTRGKCIEGLFSLRELKQFWRDGWVKESE